METCSDLKILHTEVLIETEEKGRKNSTASLKNWWAIFHIFMYF